MLFVGALYVLLNNEPTRYAFSRAWNPNCSGDTPGEGSN